MLQPLVLFIFDSPTQIMFVVAIVVLLFGAGRLPQLAKSLGQTRKAFREGMREAELEENSAPARIAPAGATPQISNMSDDELMAEMRRRVETNERKVNT